MGALNGAVNVTNGWDRIFSPDNFGSFVHGIPEFFGGIVQTAGCGVGALLQAGRIVAEQRRGRHPDPAEHCEAVHGIW